MQNARPLLVITALALYAGCTERSPTPLEPTPLPQALVTGGPIIVINEIMANPSIAADTDGEWFEVHNRGTSAVDLQGWSIASNNDTPHTISGSLSVPAGGYVVLGRNGDTGVNGGVTLNYVYGTGMTLANTSDWLALRDGAGTTVDSVTWATSMPDGKSRGVKDPSADNTDAKGANWQTQTSVFGAGDKGTPGARNDGYIGEIVTVTVGPSTARIAVGGTQNFGATARDADGQVVTTTFTWSSSNTAVATIDSNGRATGVSAGSTTIRATAPNGVYGEAALTVIAGDVIVNEVMADPSASTDADGEWFEVYNRGPVAVDLQGWIIRSNNDSQHTIGSSVSVPAGGYVVLGRNGNTSVNGGVTLGYVYGTGLTLANGSDWLVLRDPAGSTVDSVTWATAMPAGNSRGVVDKWADNTDVKGSNWSTQTSTFGAGDKGTPGAANDVTGSATAELVVRVLDIGQGDAIYITNGTTKIFIDGGVDTTVFRQHLDALGLSNTTIDVAIFSHAHFDHYNGLRELFKSARGITLGHIYENQDASTNVSLVDLRDSISARVARGQLVYRDTDDPCGNGSTICTITMNGGAKLHVMRPNPSGSTANNRSTPLKLVGPDSASFTMWFAGDGEHEQIEWMNTTYNVNPGMNVNVLKGDHHGSCNGIRSSYLDQLTPEWVTFGVGSSNTYGHVHNQTKDLLRARSVPWYRTDLNGTITIRTPGTPGGGYTVSVAGGSASMDGSTDRASSQTACSSL
ncbi:MAG: lamin tail domain-containing protein [Gemmatimonadota bacterium]